MKEYSPKPDLWSKIQQRKDFDSQVREHAKNLPEKMPKADLWGSIQKEMDRKKPMIALWKYGIAAASIGMILALIGIAYLEFGNNNDVTSPLTTGITVKAPELNSSNLTAPVETEPAVGATKQTEAIKPPTNVSEQKSITRISPATIEVPTVELPDVHIEENLITEAIIPPPPDVAPKQTYHKVQISWGLQERIKLKTTIGSQIPESTTDSQFSRANPTGNSIKIRFQRN
ncbi:hypothetical protein LZF95_22085 [Algoriphagus sp. AGSA1]|uniref:hypothetical protein n=1 Tax=Algoriphagus sp. AGSA1 TaxID=2907213 RepID=UPI001F3EED2B|nr:hypothetical protein [Algoriphagus sp. AGSA1]MCE7057387.1 hypothetical protein [Algoriphagus sp. AGSA1]